MPDAGAGVDDWIAPMLVLGADSERSGLETFDKYKYQVKVAFTWCLHLVRADVQSGRTLLAVIPEAHEDLAAVWRNDDDGTTLVQLIQIKAVEAPPTTPSQVVSRYGLLGLMQRWSEASKTGQATLYSLVACTPIPTLTNAIREWNKERAQESPPAKRDQILAGLVAQFTKEVDEDEAFAFLNALQIVPSFPSPRHIDHWNLSRLYHLRLEQGRDLSRIDEEYQRCLGVLSDAFSKVDPDPDYSRLGESLDIDADWLQQLGSRGVPAARILELLSGSEVPPDWSSLSVKQRRDTAIVQVLNWVEEQSARLSMLNRGVDADSAASGQHQAALGEESRLGPYRRFLSLVDDRELTRLIAVLRSDEAVDSKREQLDAFTSRFDNSTRPGPAMPIDPRPGPHAITVVNAEMVPDEERSGFWEWVTFLEPLISSPRVSEGARHLFALLIRKGRLDQWGFRLTVKSGAQAMELFGVSLNRFADLVEELSQPEVGLAYWSEEDCEFGTSRIQGHKFADFPDMVPDWEGLVKDLQCDGSKPYATA